ncbi:MAG: DUF58 domain-containing protein [Moritella sp.]|uniref:DUF58 domain-containing protein n=1 Tax=Moritella sp. TaxID=78556 RepID=UPI0029BA5B5E|nr:DUF58 domain-containing protein [Moritella sp.]MDX2319164.1 DUF58 domain-containing protein [Moritella sp.]
MAWNTWFSTTDKSGDSLHDDPRIYTDLNDLLKIKAQTVGFSFSPKQGRCSIFSGLHESRLRGRGLNFEELRHYNNGDDVKNLDWKVTLRTGKPHVRAYSEEKERQIWLCVDQRQSMFFSSQQTMKSVVAANIAALCLWRVLADADRVGGYIFNDHTSFHFKPLRSNALALQFIQQLHRVNHQLQVGIADIDVPVIRLTDMLATLQALQAKSKTFVIISDWYGFDEECADRLRALQQHNDVIAVHISDPLEQNLINVDSLITSDGHHQLQLSSQQLQRNKNALQHAYQAAFLAKHNLLQQALQLSAFSIIDVGTNGNEINQFKSAFHVNHKNSEEG